MPEENNRFQQQKERSDRINLSQVWTTERVDQLFKDIDEGLDIKATPFWDNKPEWRAANVIFEYTEEEIEEIRKCSTDILYFANKFCFAMTDNGVQHITLRDYQEDMLREMQDNNKVIILAPRQIGKTIVNGIFLTWFLLFNADKNLMVLSNTGATTIEIIDKIKVILSNLPFFLKPGIIKNNEMTIKIDNGCRLFGRNTTKTASIGYALHLVFLDEMAHIHPNFIEPFWRSVYPTLSASKKSRIVISSTPNGMNKFYDIYIGALEKKNEFQPVRIDWWQVPGRDEAWKENEIANLGSEEDFNQEYGNQFLASSKLLLDFRTLSQIKHMSEEFKWVQLTELHDKDLNYEHLRWHPKFNLDNIKPTDRFAFTIDTSGGGGGDYTVLNILKLVPMPIKMMEQLNTFADESDFMALLQVGLFRSNHAGIEELQPILETLLYDVFGEDVVKIVLEMDFKGNLLHDRMSAHAKFFDDMFVHTKHSENAKRLLPGIKLNPKNKLEFCSEFRRLVKLGRIISTEKETGQELLAFGLDKKGSYSSQIGHDDIAMSEVNLVPFFTSEQFFEMVEDVYDTLDEKYKNVITIKLTGTATATDANKGFDKDFLLGLMS